MLVKVQKKSGAQEDFDRNKVLNGVLKSGASSAEAESVANQVEVWVVTAAVNGVIQSAEVRNKVLEILRTVNPMAAVAFETYKKPTVTVSSSWPQEVPPAGGSPMETPPAS